MSVHHMNFDRLVRAQKRTALSLASNISWLVPTTIRQRVGYSSLVRRRWQRNMGLRRAQKRLVGWNPKRPPVRDIRRGERVSFCCRCGMWPVMQGLHICLIVVGRHAIRLGIRVGEGSSHRTGVEDWDMLGRGHGSCGGGARDLYSDLQLYL